MNNRASDTRKESGAEFSGHPKGDAKRLSCQDTFTYIVLCVYRKKDRFINLSQILHFFRVPTSSMKYNPNKR
ncbi:hypothetical protein QE152_g13920 [Popillia japonica]|uniref:Uncharacterized protein n=1 Tax=Popillia japonica TaxID=7064 RepID=A0AAW1LAL9_POPJA